MTLGRFLLDGCRFARVSQKRLCEGCLSHQFKVGKEIKKLGRIITRVMDSHKENADSSLYLDLPCLRTYKVDPLIMLYEELKRERFRDISELDRFKDGCTAAVDEYVKLFHEYSH